MTSGDRSDLILYLALPGAGDIYARGLAALSFLPPSGHNACSPSKAEKNLTGSAIAPKGEAGTRAKPSPVEKEATKQACLSFWDSCPLKL